MRWERHLVWRGTAQDLLEMSSQWDEIIRDVLKSQHVVVRDLEQMVEFLNYLDDKFPSYHAVEM